MNAPTYKIGDEVEVLTACGWQRDTVADVDNTDNTVAVTGRHRTISGVPCQRWFLRLEVRHAQPSTDPRLCYLRSEIAKMADGWHSRGVNEPEFGLLKWAADQLFALLQDPKAGGGDDHGGSKTQT